MAHLVGGIRSSVAEPKCCFARRFFAVGRHHSERKQTTAFDFTELAAATIAVATATTAVATLASA